MKKIFIQLILFFIIIAISKEVFSQTTVLNITFPGDSNLFVNSGSVQWVLSTENPSSGYSGSSGGSNLHSQSGAGTAIVTYSGLSTLGYANLQIIWGARKGTGQSNIVFEWRAGTGNWNAVSFQDVNANNQWALINNGNYILLGYGAVSNNLQFRWKITNPVSYRIDDIKVIGNLDLDPATRLVITNISGIDCPSLKKNKPFKVIIQSQDNNGLPAPVSQNTGLYIERMSGTGNVTGTPYGTLYPSSPVTIISGIMYDVAEINVRFKVTKFYGQSLSPAWSNYLNFTENANSLGFGYVPANGYTNTLMSVYVLGLVPGGGMDSCFNGPVTLSQYSGPSGGLKGTLTGNCTFDNIYFSKPGTYKIQASSPGLTPAISSDIEIIQGTPGIKDIYIPQYIQGSSGSNNNRMPYIYFVELYNLLPFSTYRYFNQAVNLTDPDNFNGVGNIIYPYFSSNFIRTTLPDLSTVGNYSEFTTDYLGKYKGWFILEPTADSRFAPGSELKMRINLNDGLGGSTIVNRLTTYYKVNVINFGAASPNGGVPLFETNASSTFLSKNIVLFYRNNLDTISGRSLMSAAIIEADGFNMNSLAEYFEPYRTVIDEQNQRYGTILPSGIPSGVVRIEQRSLVGGYLESYETGSLISYATSTNGIWPPGVDTKNLPSSSTPVIIHPVFINVGIIQENELKPNKFALHQNYPNPFNPVTMIKFEIPMSSFVNLVVYDILGREVAKLVNEKLNSGSYIVDWNAGSYPSGMYFYKLTTDNFTDVKKMMLIK